MSNFDGEMIVTADVYRGFGFLGDDNYSMDCQLLSANTGDQIRLRLTMGQYIDYIYPAGAQDVCTMLSSPGTWFWHSYPDLAGPFVPRNGLHQALLGGWLYGNDQGLSPASAGDGRTWGSFWGTHLYFEETGGCCHGVKGDAIGFVRAFSWEYQVISSNSGARRGDNDERVAVQAPDIVME